jgi:hypothetical protein
MTLAKKSNCTYGYGTLVHHGICMEDELKIKVTEKMVEETLQMNFFSFGSPISLKANPF